MPAPIALLGIFCACIMYIIIFLPAPLRGCPFLLPAAGWELPAAVRGGADRVGLSAGLELGLDMVCIPANELLGGGE